MMASDENAKNLDHLADEVEELNGPIDGMNSVEESKPVQRKFSLKNIPTKALDLNSNINESDLYDNNMNEDEYNDIDVIDDDEENQGLLKGHNGISSFFSFQVKVGKNTYDISFPTFSYISSRIRNTDWSSVYRVGWIVLTLYVMTETMRRFDNHTGAFSGQTAMDRSRYQKHLIENANQITTIYGNPNQPNGAFAAPNSGLSVSNSEHFSIRDQPANQAQQVNPPPPPQQQQQQQQQPQQQNQQTIQEYAAQMKSQKPFATLPPMLEERLLDTTIPLTPTDTPIFWHIPRAGGTMVKAVLGTCLQRVMASETGILDGHDQDKTLQIIERQKPAGKFVNVDTSTLPGLERAKKLKLADSGLAQTIVTGHFQEGSTLFESDEVHHARWFAIFRHPVQRVESNYNYMNAMNTWQNNPDINTIEDYANSDLVESNWMIRYLVGKKSGDVGINELNMAKEIIRKKMVVGLYSEISTSLDRFFHYFDFGPFGEEQRRCVNRLLHDVKVGESINNNPIPEGDRVWNRLLEVNNWDMKLYEYVQQLFVEQQALIHN